MTNSLIGELIACHDCDMLHKAESRQPGAVARCVRCDAVLYRNRRNSIERALALTLTGLTLFVLTNTLPFLSFEMNGQQTQTTLTIPPNLAMLARLAARQPQSWCLPGRSSRSVAFKSHPAGCSATVEAFCVRLTQLFPTQ